MASIHSSDVRSAERPLLFACSGCSNAGATADRMARKLNAMGVGEMSCLAGVAAKKKPFLKKLENREIWVIDGCPIHCAASIFQQGPVQRCGTEPPAELAFKHVRLYEAGLKKHAPLPDEGAFAKLLRYAISGGPVSTLQPQEHSHD